MLLYLGVQKHTFTMFFLKVCLLATLKLYFHCFLCFICLVFEYNVYKYYIQLKKERRKCIYCIVDENYRNNFL